jgi:hypothetical protein
MKRMVMGLATGALGMLLLAPCVNAQTREDMQADHGAIAANREKSTMTGRNYVRIGVMATITQPLTSGRR